MTHVSRNQVVRTLLLASAALAAVVVVGESTAQAQYGRGYYGGYYGRRHDGGFFRFTAGLGYMEANDSYHGDTVSFSGVGATFSGAVGGIVAPNLAIYGELVLTSVVDTDQSQNGYYQGYSGLDVTQYGIGPGITYYFEPINLYLAGSLLLTRVSFSDSSYGDPIASSHFGLGLGFMVGKEWWVTPDWGIGVAGHLQYASMTNTLYSGQYGLTDLSTFVFSVLFTATYN